MWDWVEVVRDQPEFIERAEEVSRLGVEREECECDIPLLRFVMIET